MSAVVVLLIGWVMMNQVTEGVLDSRRQGARTEAAAQIRDTQAQLDAADSTAQDTGVLLNQLVSENVTRGADGLYDVVLLIPANAQDPTTTSARVTQGVRPESIPTEMRNNVAVDRDGKLWDTYTEVQYDDARAPQPALVVGAQVRLKSERFELYYLFPLAPQQQTLDVVQRRWPPPGSCW